MILGEKAGSDLIIGNIYTLAPGIIAIIFILVARTDNLDSLWKQFDFPGFNWILFGLAYTIVVLSLTILTGLLLGELVFNTNYSPFSEELESLKSQNPFLDIPVYIFVVGIINYHK